MLWHHKIVSKVYNVIGNGNSGLEIGIRPYLKTGFVCFFPSSRKNASILLF